MNVVCLDMEGVIVPEIWIAFSEASGIPELRRTTRDEPDYNKLMNWRLGMTSSPPSIRFRVPRSSSTSCAQPRRPSSFRIRSSSLRSRS